VVNTTRYAANRTLAAMFSMFAVTMVVLLGLLAGVEGNVHNGVITVDNEVGMMILLFAIITPAGLGLAVYADTKLREHVHAEQLVERVRAQIASRSDRAAPEQPQSSTRSSLVALGAR